MPVNLPQAFPDVLGDQDFHLILPSNEIKMGVLLSFAFVLGILLSLHSASLRTRLLRLMPWFLHATHMDVPTFRVATVSHMLWNYEGRDMWISPNRPTTDEDPGKTQAPSRSGCSLEEEEVINWRLIKPFARGVARIRVQKCTSSKHSNAASLYFRILNTGVTEHWITNKGTQLIF